MGRTKTDTAIIELVARNVRLRRKAAGLSQEELADLADIDRTYVSQVERGLRNVTISVLARIAMALKIGPGVLLASPTSPPPKRKLTRKPPHKPYFRQI